MATRKRARGGTPWLEWAIGALGALAFVAILVILIEAGLRPKSPPQIAVEVDAVTQTEHGYVVEFTAVNSSPATGAAVEITATLHQGGELAEERRMTFDFLPPHSARRGGVIFTRDPRGGELSIRVEGFAEP